MPWRQGEFNRSRSTTPAVSLVKPAAIEYSRTDAKRRDRKMGEANFFEATWNKGARVSSQQLKMGRETYGGDQCSQLLLSLFGLATHQLVGLMGLAHESEGRQPRLTRITSLRGPIQIR